MALVEHRLALLGWPGYSAVESPVTLCLESSTSHLPMRLYISLAWWAPDWHQLLCQSARVASSVYEGPQKHCAGGALSGRGELPEPGQRSRAEVARGLSEPQVQV